MVCERGKVYYTIVLYERSMTLERDLHPSLRRLDRSRERDGGEDSQQAERRGETHYWMKSTRSSSKAKTSERAKRIQA